MSILMSNKLTVYLVSYKGVGGGWGDSHMEKRSMLVGNFDPKGDHLGVAQAFCDP